MQEKRWNLAEVDEAKVEALQSALGINRTLCRLLVSREVDTYEKARKFFRPSLNDLHDPYRMKGMDWAVERIREGIDRNEKILIYGDYDVDGTTAVSTLLLYFRSFYPNVDFYIPDRYDEGYGISGKGVEYAASNNFSLTIALDCGIRANEQIAYANSLGVDFIVCDHHLPGEELPPAYAILDPKQAGCPYPYKELSGCGIGLKLVQALIQKLGQEEDRYKELLDLAVISIAADIVPITGENRVLAYFGLKKINTRPLPGIAQLMASARLKRPLNISNIVFGIAPRINAAGRMDDARHAVNLLIGEDGLENEAGADLLNGHNTTRRDLDKTITEEAWEQIKANPNYEDRKSTVVYNPGWHKGVIGIVASRLMERHYRPTIVLTKSKGMLAGSARSVRNFDIHEALTECAHLLERFGGHKYAAGMELAEENLDAFKQSFEDVVASRISPDDLIPEIRIEGDLSFDEITPSFVKILKQFAPFGPSNPNPVFRSTQVQDKGYARIVGEDHLKLNLQKNGKSFDAIAFRQADKLDLVLNQKYMDICYTIEENEYQGMTSIQLNIKDIKPST